MLCVQPREQGVLMESPICAEVFVFFFYILLPFIVEHTWPSTSHLENCFGWAGDAGTEKQLRAAQARAGRDGDLLHVPVLLFGGSLGLGLSGESQSPSGSPHADASKVGKWSRNLLPRGAPDPAGFTGGEKANSHSRAPRV